MIKDTERRKRSAAITIMSALAYIAGIFGAICSMIGKSLPEIFRPLVGESGTSFFSSRIVIVIPAFIVWLILFLLYYEEMPKRIRRIAIFSIIGIPIITGVFIAKAFFPPYKITVLVADFDGPDPESYRVTENILNQLRNIISEYEDIRIKPLRKEITEQDGRDTARAKLKESKAAIILWGWYGVTRKRAIITAQFEVKKADHLLALGRGNRKVNVPIHELENYQLQEQLSKEMSLFVLLVILLTRLQTKDYSGATAIATRISRILGNQTANEISRSDSSYIHAVCGMAYLLDGTIDSAIESFNQAIDYDSTSEGV